MEGLNVIIDAEHIITFLFSTIAGCCILFFVFQKFIDGITESSLKKHQESIDARLKEKQKIIDEEIEKLKTANMRLNHIMLSLYDEEEKALKNVSISVLSLRDEVARIYDFQKNPLGSLNGSEHEVLEPLYTSMCECYGLMNDNINSSAVFLDESMYNKLQEIRIYFTHILHPRINNFTPINDDGMKLISNKTNELITYIREHLTTKKTEIFNNATLK